MIYMKGKESAQQFIDHFDHMLTKLRKVSKVEEEQIVGNFVAAIKPYVKEVFHRYDAANGKLSIEELRILLLNEEASEEESKKRSGEGEPKALNTNVENESKVKAGEKRKTPGDGQIRPNWDGYAGVSGTEPPLFGNRRKWGSESGTGFKIGLLKRRFGDRLLYDLDPGFSETAS